MTTRTTLPALMREAEAAFDEVFGQTPESERIADLLRQAEELGMALDPAAQRMAVGNLLSALLVYCAERGHDPAALVRASLANTTSNPIYRSLGRRLNLACLGGAFDPVTRGHIRSVQYVLERSGAHDSGGLMPVNVHMYGKRMEGARHRLAMCEIAASEDRRIRVLDYEIRHGLVGETYSVMKRVRQDPEISRQYRISMIFGLDNANSFPTWNNFRLTERIVPFVVIPRRGVQPEPGVDWYRKAPHTYLDGEPVMESSSTEVRRLLRERSSTAEERLEELLHPGVLAYIRQHGLYGVAA